MASHEQNGVDTQNPDTRDEEALRKLPPELQKEVERLEELFTVDTALLKKITKRFREELDQGLKAQGQNIPMNITWVTSLPTGHETGTYLTLDLGGTNLRVCLITLTTPGNTKVEREEKYTIPGDVKRGTADKLWDFIADLLQRFVEEDHRTDKAEPLPLGFTFSYPATQERIDHGALQTWTKGWDVDGVEGQDVAGMLRQAIEKRNLPIKLVALINDTTGALVASAYNDPETIVGAVFGTGCNAAYMERRKNIPKLVDHDGDLMAINCEYGAFDNSHRVLPRTRYDETIDEQSPRPGEQTFEKMSAGLYLGEIFRLVLVDLRERGVVFKSTATAGSRNGGRGGGGDGGDKGTLPAGNADDGDGDDRPLKPLDDPYVLDTGFLSTVENDTSPDLTESRSLFESTLSADTSSGANEPLSPTPAELVFFRHLARLVAVRGARLCACGVSAICQGLGVKSGHVAADGSVAIKHPHFRRRWEQAVAEILDIDDDSQKDRRIKLTSAEDGSGIGAAVISALTMGRREEK